MIDWNCAGMIFPMFLTTALFQARTHPIVRYRHGWDPPAIQHT